ncbi:MAG: potassium-transporting ATPase subunit KdpC [Spirochaetales bacterium]|nr:potassium-transporting ATPase subunit KdpC [Spirochaetales bacterium]
MKTLWSSLRLVLWATVVLGIAYPLVVTSLAQVLFPAQANGSLVSVQGHIVGSSLIGQDFSTKPSYFVGRPSATGDHPYNPLASGGSNLTVAGKAFQDKVTKLRNDWVAKATSAGVTSPVPEALVTASASGLDPDLDLNATLWQVPFVAKERHLDPASLRALVESNAVRPTFPWDPPAFVNVLALNLALDRMSPAR